MIFFLLAAITLAGSYAYYLFQKQQVRSQQEHHLSTVTDLKIQQLSDWRKERLKDAEYIAANTFVTEPIRSWLESGAPNDQRYAALLKWMASLQHGGVYDAVYLLDALGRRVAQSSNSSTAYLPSQQQPLPLNQAGQRPALIDFYRDARDGRIHLNIVIPLWQPAGMRQATGTLVLEIDPERTLYPLIKNWPMYSKTAETMLGRYENGQILYLNNLRNHADAPVNLRLPGNDSQLPMSRVAHGYEGTMEGHDYRGMPVLAAMRRVPDSPWLVVSKIDIDEIYAPLRERLWVILAVSGTLMLLLISWMGFVWRRQVTHFQLLEHQRTETLLRQGHAQLEQIVSERTERLLHANQQLLDEIHERLRIETDLRVSADRLKLIFNSVKDAIFIHDRHGKIIKVNQQMLALYQVSEEDALNMTIAEDFSGPDNPLADLLTVWNNVIAGEDMTFEWQARRPHDGHLFPVEVFLTRMQADDGINVLATVRDITVYKLHEQQLLLTAKAFETGGEGIVITDAGARILRVNSRFTEITGYTAVEATGQTTRLLHSGRHDAEFYEKMWDTLQKEGSWQGEIWNRRKNGEVYPEWLSISTVCDHDGHLTHYVAMFSDISRKKASEELIWNQANFDALTGLPNRRMFFDRLSQRIKKTHGTGQPLALMFLDIDRFKEINDTLGHSMGDNLLKESARRLGKHVGASDTVARLGGDEFAILLDDINDHGIVERTAQEILRILAQPFRLGDEVVYVSASIGITLYPADAADPETLLQNADHAMYAAKKNGRNRFNFFTPSMQEAAQAWIQLANDLRSALAEHQFRLYYQPIVELATGNIQKAEALIRWQHPTRGMVNPAEFIPVAEETGLIIEIGDWVFREAAAQVARWHASHHGSFQISVNKSPAQFHSARPTHRAWFEYLRQLGLPGQCIVVEITEGLLLDTSSEVTQQLMQLRNAGFNLSIDDFGTGYSSLSYLRKFDVDYLKIDRSFVRNLAPDSDDMALCAAIIMMAHKLNIKVIAEGIETMQQRDLLAAAGCDFGQGYLFSRPVPAEEFEQLL